jgi:chromosomal replication initiation ATPase DnaA
MIGERGAGKTHLANIWAGRLGASIMLSASDVFGAWYNISSSNTEQKYFVLEDIDRINDELLLFYMYNAILERGLYLLMTTKSHPLRWEFSLPDLKSRVATMNFINIEKPSDEVIIIALENILKQRGLQISQDCSGYLVKRIERSYESINYWAEQIDFALGNGRKITLPMLRELMK